MNSTGAEAPLHPAQVKSQEDAILAQANAIQKKREKQWQTHEEPCKEPPRCFSNWDYLMFEAQWMVKDMAQEKLWKKKAAFFFANIIANSNVKLRPVTRDSGVDVKAGEPDDELDRSLASRRASRSRAPKGKKGASKGRRTSKTNNANDGDEDIEDEAELSPLPKGTSTEGAFSPLLDCPIRLSYRFDVSWTQSVKSIVYEKNDEIIIKRLLECQDYELEYEAAKMEVEESWRDAAVKRAAEKAAIASAGAAVHTEQRAGRLVGRNTKYADEYEGVGVGTPGISGLESSQLDDTGDVRDISSRRGGGRKARRRPDDDDKLYTGGGGTKRNRPDQSNLRAAPVHTGRMWNTEDDRLLCCIMTEFGDNNALVADVYVSTRRLEGIHCDASHTEQRIRQLVEERSQLEDFPLPKSEAREFLQQSIPCMASVVRAYQSAVQPIALEVVEERKQEEYNARSKRAEILVQPNMPKHATHDRFMLAATKAYGTFQMPKAMLEKMRAAARIQPGARSPFNHHHAARPDDGSFPTTGPTFSAPASTPLDPAQLTNQQRHALQQQATAGVYTPGNPGRPMGSSSSAPPLTASNGALLPTIPRTGAVGGLPHHYALNRPTLSRAPSASSPHLPPAYAMAANLNAVRPLAATPVGSQASMPAMSMPTQGGPGRPVAGSHGLPHALVNSRSATQQGQRYHANYIQPLPGTAGSMRPGGSGTLSQSTSTPGVLQAAMQHMLGTSGVPTPGSAAASVTGAVQRTPMPVTLPQSVRPVSHPATPHLPTS